jgi:hypothetical protein
MDESRVNCQWYPSATQYAAHKGVFVALDLNQIVSDEPRSLRTQDISCSSLRIASDVGSGVVSVGQCGNKAINGNEGIIVTFH